MADANGKVKPTQFRLERHPSVYTTSLWERGQLQRTYLNLRGAKSNFAGDRSMKIYFDHNTGELICERGKGTISGEFHESLSALLSRYHHVIR